MSSELPDRESLVVEFKSDQRKLPDNDLVLAAVCLANTDGGTIYLGVEKDGAVTGLHPEHRDMGGLAAMIANRTVPPLSVRAKAVEIQGHLVAVVEVPWSARLVASSTGTLQRRRLKVDGEPECIPFLPHEFISRQADLGLADPSTMPVSGATLDDLNPLERERVRQAIQRYGGDRSLIGLDDTEFDGALGLVRRVDGQPVPTVAGLLLLGHETALREHLPTHEVAFQVLDDTEVRVNEFSRAPLLRCVEWIEDQFRARLVEREIQVGLFRVAVPQLDPRVLREAVVNAVTHRDYARLGAVHVRWQRDTLTVSNPGGFVDGVTLQNLLVVEPRPRNPLLADTFKRLGLAERTGRGVDLIFQGLLRYGRPAPNYGRSDRTSVIVELSCAEADLGFLRLVLEEEERRGASLPLETLLVISLLRRERRIDVGDVAAAIQKETHAARAVLERLVEVGLVAAHGVKKSRTYTLTADVYRRLGLSAEYVRQAGFDQLQQEQMIRSYVREHGSIARKDVVALCRLSPQQATRLLRRLVEAGVLTSSGKGKGTRYARGANL